MELKFLKTTLLTMLVLLTSSFSANALLITINNTTEVGVLSLSESFTSFYSYGTSNSISSDTGYEQSNAGVMFLAEYDNELALFTTLNIANHANEGGAVDMFISDFQSANVVLVDDADETNATGFKWAWNGCCSDGMVYKIDDKDNFDLDIVFSNASGLDNGFKFLSFSGNQSPVSHDVGASFSVQTAQVSEPASLAIFALSVFGFMASRRIKK